jgi:regulator of sirC expression with transglutaminase-like and TPR domain
MSRHPFDLLMALDDEQIRLDCAALHLARDVYPQLDLRTWLDRLDALAAEVAELRAGLTAPLRYAAMREVLVERHGFRGNVADYDDPQNSYLNRVLQRRTGLPIALAVVWIEVGRRLKWPVAGVGLPGHFLVRFDDPERFVLADVFNGGRSLALKDCADLVKENFGDQLDFRPEMLEPAATRDVLVRMLNNLRTLYFSNEDWLRLADVLQRLRAAQPENVRLLQELAAAYFHRGEFRTARDHLAAYLEQAPDADDSPLVRRSLERIDSYMAALN